MKVKAETTSDLNGVDVYIHTESGTQTTYAPARTSQHICKHAASFFIWLWTKHKLPPCIHRPMLYVEQRSDAAQAKAALLSQCARTDYCQ